ncbi:MAG: Fibronectin, type III domain protein, partial [Berkelbacteria bacterium GW2011_GWA2_35_9]
MSTTRKQLFKIFFIGVSIVVAFGLLQLNREVSAHINTGSWWGSCSDPNSKYYPGTDLQIKSEGTSSTWQGDDIYKYLRNPSGEGCETNTSIENKWSFDGYNKPITNKYLVKLELENVGGWFGDGGQKVHDVFLYGAGMNDFDVRVFDSGSFSGGEEISLTSNQVQSDDPHNRSRLGWRVPIEEIGSTHTIRLEITPEGDIDSGPVGVDKYVLRTTNIVGVNDEISIYSNVGSDDGGAVRPMSVEVKEPANGANFNTGSNIEVTALVRPKVYAEYDAVIKKVEFYANGVKFGQEVKDSDSNPSYYSFTYPNSPNGTYLIVVKATNEESEVVTSDPVTVTINDPLPLSCSFSSSSITLSHSSPHQATTELSATGGDGSYIWTALGSEPSSGGTLPTILTFSDIGTQNIEISSADQTSICTLTVNPAPNATPTVSITSPADGAVFNNAPVTIPITITASDPDGDPLTVEVYNGATKLPGTATKGAGTTYTYNWASVGAGSYTIKAKAIDNFNASTESTPITFSVQNPTTTTVVPTTTTITRPITTTTTTTTTTQPAVYTLMLSTDKTSGTAPLDVILKATVGGGTVSQSNDEIRFYNDTVLLGTHTDLDSAEVRYYHWDNISAGTYTKVHAEYYQGRGASGVLKATSSNITITVQNPTPTIDSFTAPASINSGEKLTDSIALTWTTTGADTVDIQYKNSSNVWTNLVTGRPADGSYSFTPTSTHIVSNKVITRIIAHKASANDVTSVEKSTTVNSISCARIPTLSINTNTVNEDGVATLTYSTNGIFASASIQRKLGTTGAWGNIFTGLSTTANSTKQAYPALLYTLSSTYYHRLVVNLNTTYCNDKYSTPEVTLTVNKNPTIVSFSTDKTLYNAGENSILSSVVKDPDGSIVKVQYYDGANQLGPNIVPSPANPVNTNYSSNYTWSNPTTGTHSLTVVVTDNNGAVFSSGAVVIYVNTFPTIVSLTTDKSSYNIGEIPVLTSKSRDTDGKITKLQYLDNATQIGSDINITQATNNTEYTHNYSWSPAPTSGIHILTVKATDDRGAVTSSGVVSIRVYANPVIVSPLVSQNKIYFAQPNLPWTANSWDAVPNGQYIIKVKRSSDSTAYFSNEGAFKKAQLDPPVFSSTVPDGSMFFQNAPANGTYYWNSVANASDYIVQLRKVNGSFSSNDILNPPKNTADEKEIIVSGITIDFNAKYNGRTTTLWSELGNDYWYMRVAGRVFPGQTKNYVWSNVLYLEKRNPVLSLVNTAPFSREKSPQFSFDPQSLPTDLEVKLNIVGGPHTVLPINIGTVVSGRLQISNFSFTEEQWRSIFYGNWQAYFTVAPVSDHIERSRSNIITFNKDLPSQSNPTLVANKTTAVAQELVKFTLNYPRSEVAFDHSLPNITLSPFTTTNLLEMTFSNNNFDLNNISNDYLEGGIVDIEQNKIVWNNIDSNTKDGKVINIPLKVGQSCDSNDTQVKLTKTITPQFGSKIINNSNSVSVTYDCPTGTYNFTNATKVRTDTNEIKQGSTLTYKIEYSGTFTEGSGSGNGGEITLFKKIKKIPRNIASSATQIYKKTSQRIAQTKTNRIKLAKAQESTTIYANGDGSDYDITYLVNSAKNKNLILDGGYGLGGDFTFSGDLTFNIQSLTLINGAKISGTGNLTINASNYIKICRSCSLKTKGYSGGIATECYAQGGRGSDNGADAGTTIDYGDCTDRAGKGGNWISGGTGGGGGGGHSGNRAGAGGGGGNLGAGGGAFALGSPNQWNFGGGGAGIGGTGGAGVAKTTNGSAGIGTSVNKLQTWINAGKKLTQGGGGGGGGEESDTDEQKNSSSTLG